MKAGLTFLFIGLIFSATSGMMLKLEHYYLGDNIDFRYNTYTISADNISIGFGTLNTQLQYSMQEHTSTSFGIASFLREYLGLKTSYSMSLGKVGATIHAGIHDILDPKSFDLSNISTGAKLRTSMGLNNSGLSLSSEISVDYGVARDNPVSTALAIPKLTTKADVGVGLKSWQYHAFFSHSWYGSVNGGKCVSYLDHSVFFNSVRVHALMEDTADGISTNSSISAGFYAFGPPLQSLPWLYTGMSFNFSNYKKDFYYPLRTEMQKGRVAAVYEDKTEYAHFPYATASSQICANVIVAATYRTDIGKMPISKTDLKLSVPVFSNSRQPVYYQEEYGSLISFKKGMYSQKGLGPLSAELSVGKDIGKAFTVEAKGVYFAKPYAPYTYWGKDCYRYFSSRLAITSRF